MLDNLVSKIRQRKSTIPTRQDIADVLESVGEPGIKQQEKLETVESLFSNLGHGHKNNQGHDLLDDLEGYGQW